MKIYTKTGDNGDTGLMGGKRLSKDSLRIQSYGEVDELNAILGICRWHNLGALLEDILHQLQTELFNLGSDLATPLEEKLQIPRITPEQIAGLENWIDYLEARIDPLKNFILPGGSATASNLHLARTVSRRAERTIVALSKKEKINENIIPYINRLSDLLFVMARFSNKFEKIEEEKWTG
jgi:cob(I)alamin adenosyltransferase